MWIKICGLTTHAAVTAAVEAGANAVGFVFTSSKRQVNVMQAVVLAQASPKSVARIAVMQHPSQLLVDEVCALFKPDMIQTDYEDLPLLHVPTGIGVLPVVRSGKVLPMQLPGRLLFEGPVSGTGERSDWARAADLAKGTQLILAGGLDPLNIASAIAEVRPYGVDVSSGVESAPGIKDLKKIAEFVQAAQSAR